MFPSVAPITSTRQVVPGVRATLGLGINMIYATRNQRVAVHTVRLELVTGGYAALSILDELQVALADFATASLEYVLWRLRMTTLTNGIRGQDRPLRPLE